MISRIFDIKKILLCTLMCLSTLISIYAGTEKLTLRIEGSNIDNAATLNLKDDKFNQLFGTPNFTTKQVNNTVVLGINPNSNLFFSTSYTIEVDVEVRYLNQNNIWTALGVKTLTIDYDPANQTSYTDKDVLTFSGGHYVETKVIAIRKDANPIAIAPDNIYLESNMEIERYYDFNSQNIPLSSDLTLQTSHANSKELIATWERIDGAEEYDLEWTWVNDYDPNSIQTFTYDFKNNATRVRVNSTQYTVPMVYESGTLLFRYRAVGKSGLNFDVPIEGVWSTDGAGITESGNVSSYPTVNKYAVVEHNGDNINWQSSATFAEDGKRSSAVSYYDGTLRNRQSVAKLNTEDNVIAGSVIYDYQGRPAINVLPTPIYKDPAVSDPSKNQLSGYILNLNKVDVNTVYTKENFDEEPGQTCNTNLSPMDEANSVGAANYYSTQNQNKEGAQAYLPDAMGYPFVQTEYTNDQTGRVRRQGGLGQTHQLDSDHETKYFYAQPEQDELDVLFGNEAGLASYYKKNAVVDANGQLSVSYIDMHDRVVATALAGDSPSNELIDLDSYAVPTVKNSNLIQYNTPTADSKSMEVRRNILVTNSGNYTFDYSFDTEKYTDCLPGGSTVIASSYEYNDTYMFDDTRHFSMLASSPSPVLSGLNSIYQEYPSSEWGPIMSILVHENDVITNTSIWAYFENGTGIESGSLIRALVDANGNQLYYDNAGLQEVWEDVGTTTSPDSWNQLQAAANLTIGGTYYYQNGSPVNLQTTDVYIVVYTWLLNGRAPTWFDDINVEILNGNNPSGLCLDCIYEVTLSIKDDCGNEMIGRDETLNPIVVGAPITEMVGNVSPYTGVFDAACDIQVNYTTTPNPIVVALPKVGTYTVYKSLKVSADPMAYYKQQFKDNNTCGETYQNLLAQQIAAIDYSGCNLDPCEYESLLIYVDLTAYQQDNPGATQANYNEWKTDFVNNCHNDIVDPCEQMLQAMELDFYPGGQYATYEFDGVTGNIVKTSDTWSIFEIDNVNASMPDYTTMSFGAIQVSLPNGNLVSPNALTVAEFVFYFEPSWIQYMVTYHPEYCNYTFCTTNQLSYDFIEDFKKTNTFSEACSKGYLDPTNQNPSQLSSCTGLSVVDPTILANYLTNMNAYLLDIDGAGGNTVNAWQAAIAATSCNHETTSAGMSACISNYTIGSAGCDDVEVWNVFKALYIAKWMELEGTARCTAIIPPNKIRTIQDIADVMADPNIPGNNPPLNGTPISNAAADAALDNHATSICEGYADSWMNSLAACGVNLTGGQIWEPGILSVNQTYNDIKQAFIDICKNGTVDQTTTPDQLINPLGASTSPIATTIYNNVAVTQSTAQNFDDVLLFFFGAGYDIDGSCTGLLINNPPAYDATINDYAILDNCGCDKILQAEHNYALALTAGTLPSWVTSATDYLMEYEGISTQNYEKLACACDAANPTWDYNNPTWTTTQINALIEDNIYTDPALTCETCIICDEYIAKKYIFDTTYPNLLLATNYNYLLTNYLNSQFNVDFVWSDYESFEFECGAECSSNNELTKIKDLMNLYLDNRALLFNLSYNTYPVLSDFVNLIVDPTCDTYGDITFTTTVLPNGNYQINISAQGNSSSCDINCNIFLSSIDNTNNPYNANNIENFTNISCTSNNEFLLSFDVKGITHTIEGSTSCFEFCCNDGQLCYNPIIMPEEPLEDPCVTMLMEQAAYNAQILYEQYINDALATFEADYYSKCMQAQEVFSMSYESNEQHYTLYYYDQAGNLTQTVPPKGVEKLIPTSLIGVRAHRQDPITIPAVFPFHTLKTKYKYNTYNQVIEQTTPDGGTTKYWYDKIGRLKTSQNDKQADNDFYSYTSYDIHGRIVEVGELSSPDSPDDLDIQLIPLVDLNAADFPHNGAWPNVISINQVTKTFYDEEIDATIAVEFGTQGQQNLRNRITTVAFQEVYNITPTVYSNATHYSYDEHGNVITSIQEITDLVFLENNFKRTDYTYDLISGNIIKVAYQQGEADQFYHKYDYDADNRLSEVFTSKDNVLWDRDAKYKYYQHGPLARVETGDVEVQGTDYAYTIQGWLKGVNSNTLKENRDIGKDGNTDIAYPYMNIPATQHAQTGKDAFGYSLGYFDGDYNAIAAINSTDYFLADATAGTFGSRTKRNLYNGNITSSLNALQKPDGNLMDIMGYAYQYDQLNRLRHMDAYTGINYNDNNSFANAAITTDYQVNLTYDANGNILTLNRNANIASGNLAMDQMNYTYTVGTNQLDYVADAVINSPHNDIKNGQSTGNYTYTDIGELESDAAEQIETITWTVYGKVKEVIRTPAAVVPPATSKPSDLEFKYGPMGQRVLKIEKPRNPAGVLQDQEFWKYTYYAYDASGNLMATYNKKYELVGGVPTSLLEVLTLNEHPVYGSSRLGLTKENLIVSQENFNIYTNHNSDHTFVEVPNSRIFPIITSVDNTHTFRILGNKMYELSNHLGNVQVVISDRKFAIENTLTPGFVLNYEADVVSASDYYPFGSLMPGRNFSSSAYKFGFNGMEKDDEMKGSTGSSYTTYFRQYDPRLGRFMSMDPVNYPWQSDYAAFNNNPIYFADPSGAEGEGKTKRKAKRAAKKTAKQKAKTGDGGLRENRFLDSYPSTPKVENKPPSIKDKPKKAKSKLGPLIRAYGGNNPSSLKNKNGSLTQNTMIWGTGPSYFNTKVTNFFVDGSEMNHYYALEWRRKNTNTYWGIFINKQKMDANSDGYNVEASTSAELSYGKYFSIINSSWFTLSSTINLSLGPNIGIPRIVEGPHNGWKNGYFRPLGGGGSMIARVDATFVNVLTFFIAGTANHTTFLSQDTPAGFQKMKGYNSVGVKFGIGVNFGRGMRKRLK